MSFSQTLEQHQARLTPAQREMAKYILDHGEQVSFMTAKQLADAIGQSDAAVIRFAQAAGYAGFPALRESLREGLLERVGASGLPQRAGSTSDQELKAEVFDTDALLVQQTAQLNPDAVVSTVADLLVGSRRVFVSGHGTSYPLAAYLSMQLNHCLGKGQIFNMEHGDVGDRMRSVDEHDVFIGIGYLRYLPYTADILGSARKSGARIVAITDRVSSPLSAVAHHSLYVARGVRSPAWWSQVGTLVLTNWLLALVVARDPATAEKHLRASDDQLKQLGHWQSNLQGHDDLSLDQLMNSKKRANKTPRQSK